MSELDEVIDVQITVTDKAPTRPNFGVPAIMAFHNAWPDLMREYGDADELLDDGFTDESHVYEMAQKLCAQDPHPRKFKVGRLQTAYTQTIHLIPRVTTEGFIYEFTIDDTDITYTVLAGASVASICEALEPLVEAVTGITSTEDDTKVIAVAAAGEFHSYSVARGLDIFDATADPGIAGDLADIADEDDDFYGFAIDLNSADIIEAASGWAETQTKIFVTQSSDWDVLDAGESGDIASTLLAQAYTRTAGIWHRGIGDGEWAAIAWMSLMLVPDPGSATWAYKTLAGITVDQLRAGERTSLGNKNWSRYTRMGGVNVTFEGKTPSGRFIDVVHFVDWQEAEIQFDVYALLINNPKVPYTDAGISAVKGQVAGALKKGQQRGGLADTPAPVVTAPAVLDTDVSDRALRKLRDINFTGRLAGALHSLQIRGVLSV